MKFIVILICIVLAAMPTHSQTLRYNISTFVGGGSSIGEGIAATSAMINIPYGVAVNSSGDIYVACLGYPIIRRIATNGIISTIAGSLTSGFSGDGSIASSAKLNNPYGVAISSSGEIYIADSGNHVIRKISTLGIISTIAGNGTAGYSGDGELATSAQLNNPLAVAISLSGEVFFADTSNFRIRKIATNGLISTIAGNGTSVFSGDGSIATSATFSLPQGIAISSEDEIYIADSSNHRIRKISTSGIITTIAGIGTAGYSGDGSIATGAKLNNPFGIAVSSTGEIYISDSGNHRIRKIATNGNISTIAGTGLSGFSGDGSIATSAKLNNPAGIAISSSGEIFISDKTNSRIRIVSTSGIISTIAGTDPDSFGSNVPAEGAYIMPSGPPVLYNGSLVFADTSNYVRQVDLSTNIIRNLVKSIIVTGITCTKFFNNELYVLYSNYYLIRMSSTNVPVAGSGSVAGFSGDGLDASLARLSSPYGVAISSNGEIYIADTANYRIRKIAINGTISTIAGTGTAGYSGDGLVATSAKLGLPFGVAINSGGEIFIADTANNRIRKVSTNGIITTIAGTGTPGYSDGVATSSMLNGPYGIAINSSGEIYIADKNNHRIRKISGGFLTTIAGNGTAGYSGDGSIATGARLSNPYGVALDSSGEIYIADSGNHVIRKVSTNGIISTIAGTGLSGFSGDGSIATSAKLNTPSGIYINSDAEVFIADSNNNRIRKISTNGVITTIAGTGPGGNNDDGANANTTQLSIPFAFAINSKGETLIAETGGHRIRKISTNGIISTISGGVVDGIAATKAFINAKTFEFSSSGEILIADTFNNRIRKISNGTISTIAGNGMGGYNGDDIDAKTAKLNHPYMIAIDSNGEIYIADTNNHRIRKVSTNGNISTIAGTGVSGYDGDGSNATIAQLNLPQGITITSSGEIFIVDTGNQVIRKISTIGIITTIAGNGTAGFSGDGSLAITSQLNNPTGMIIGPSGEIYISDQGNQRIRKLSLCSGNESCEYQCFGLTNKNSDVCSGKGSCIGSDICNCIANYNGSKCDEYDCYGIPKNNSNVCSSHGVCISHDNCSCSLGYSGSNCQDFICYGVSSANNSSVCSSHGICTSPNNCSCNDNYTGENCQYPKCDGIASNDVNVCNGHGNCSAPNVCVCNLNYSGTFCQLTTCNGIRSDQTSLVCYGHGKCVDYNTCNCTVGYGPSNICQFPICYGYLANDTRVCNNSNGVCSGVNQCTCNYGYGSVNCDTFTCSNILASNSSVCSGHGICNGIDKCNCYSGYLGTNCEIISCYGIPKSNNSVCSGVGECSQLDTCVCGTGFRGPMCELPYISSSQATLQFNNTIEYVGEVFSTMLTLNVNHALFGQYYWRSVRLVVSFEINSQFKYSETLSIENGISSISLMVKSISQTGNLIAYAQLIDNSTLITISDNISSSNSLTIQNRPTKSSSTSTKPTASPQSSRATTDSNNVGAIVAGVIVPISVIGIGSAITAAIVTAVVLLKKKAAQAAATNQHSNIELVNL